MSYILRKGVQGFTVIDGPMSGKSFKSGIAYDEIPPQEAAKFEVIPDAAADTAAMKNSKKVKSSEE
jgi:hypothetical protein